MCSSMKVMKYLSGNNHFDTPIEYLPGVGPKTGKKLAKLGVKTIGDLIYFFPRKYLDYSQISAIAEVCREGQNLPVTIKARISGIENKKTKRRGFTVSEAIVEDGSGRLKVVWFNQPYLSKTLPIGREIILHGRVLYDRFSQGYSMSSPDWAESPKIVPVYKETDGVSSHYIAKIAAKVLQQTEDIEEFLPEPIIQENKLLGLSEAVRVLHVPNNLPELAAARHRMAFDELFLISLRGQMLKEQLSHDQAPLIDINEGEIREFVENLPFELTGDQEKACSEIFADLAHDRPMNRLLNGDVGSGKTIVAALAAYASILSGMSVMMMAPTEILANQHFALFEKIFEGKVPIRLITSTTQRQNIENDDAKKLAPKVFIGTHALLYMNEPILNVGLVIVDEQHRFGVSQRQALKQLTMNQSSITAQPPIDNIRARENVIDQSNIKTVVPHFLSMTATPIPRSLQLALFAELEVSIIRDKPQNRKEIKTRVVEEGHRQKAYEFIRAHVRSGRQVFVICPLIDEAKERQNSSNDEVIGQQSQDVLLDIDRKTVIGEHEKLSKEIFPDLRIGLLHGKQKSKEKDEVMEKFANAEIDILVSTSVVEVGVDIPNATVMMIEDAERFGLAQLHQFRGRVGRGEHQSFCFLFSNSESDKSTKRLKKMEETSDGFELAEFDLRQRGAGDIFGVEQSGFMDIVFADLGDASLISAASQAARKIVASDPGLQSHQRLLEVLGVFNSAKHFE